MLRWFTALSPLLLACALTGCAGTSQASPRAGAGKRGTHPGTRGLKTVSLQSSGHQRTYLLYVPPGDTRHRPLPLVLVFHGADDTAAHTTTETDLLSIAERRHDMILVFPQGYENTWNEGTGQTPAEQAGINDVAFTASILRRVEGHYAVERQRVVATGFSNGALMTEYLGCALSGQLTMIAPVEGQLPQAISAKCHPQVPLTVFQVDGTSDGAIPYSGGTFTGIGGIQGPALLSAPDSAQRWASLDSCSGQAQSRTTGQVTFATYGGCAEGVTVTLAGVNGGHHVWPPGYGPTLVNQIAAMSTARTASR